MTSLPDTPPVGCALPVKHKLPLPGSLVETVGIVAADSRLSRKNQDEERASAKPLIKEQSRACTSAFAVVSVFFLCVSSAFARERGHTVAQANMQKAGVFVKRTCVR